MDHFFTHTRKPRGIGGKLMVTLMNLGHAPLARWGLKHLELKNGDHVLDVGCGGGANLRAMGRRFSGGQVVGLDYSPISVEKAARVNRRAIEAGHCLVRQGDVSALPFPSDSFDRVTAFETVYFWPDLPRAFAEILRVLKPGGTFLICNECDGSDPRQEKWCSIIGQMKIYTADELNALLQTAGFQQIQNDGVPNRKWFCVTAKKP